MFVLAGFLAVDSRIVTVGRFGAWLLGAFVTLVGSLLRVRWLSEFVDREGSDGSFIRAGRASPALNDDVPTLTTRDLLMGA